MNDDFLHSRRFPKNASGPFYTTGTQTQEGWGGDCLECQAPEAEAPDLLAPQTEGNWDTYFVKQPQTEAEIQRACMAIRVCCVSALRYGGRDPEIIRMLGNTPDYSDYILDSEGRIVLVPPAASKTKPHWLRSMRQLLQHFISGLFTAPYLPGR